MIRPPHSAGAASHPPITRKHRENHQRHQHALRRFVHVNVMLVIRGLPKNVRKISRNM